MANTTKKKTTAKSKAKPKAKTKAKPSPEVKRVAKPVVTEESPPELSKAEAFYIDNNLNKTDVELATDLGKSLPAVRQHIHRTQGQSRINKLLIRQKGCTIMTEGASMAADQSRTGYVSEQAIREAVARGDYEEAARLQTILKTQRQETDPAAARRQAEYIHRIQR